LFSPLFSPLTLQLPELDRGSILEFLVNNLFKFYVGRILK